MRAPGNLDLRGTVLVVDDEEQNRKLLAQILAPTGVIVHDARSGLEALEKTDLLRPDLLVLDVMMPGLNGFEVCRQLKSGPEHRLMPVLLLTSLSGVEDRIRGLESGADDFLSKPFDQSELLTRVRSMLHLKAYTDQLEHSQSVLLTLARSIEARDPSTVGHCTRLTDLSVKLARRLHMGEAVIGALRIAGCLHDIGKVAVPDAILLKPGPLTADEWEVMRRHPVVGEEICRPLRTLQEVLPIIRHHHEKIDGSGYPDGLQGTRIPVGARILQLADVFDALTSERPYKSAMPSPEALAIMQAEVSRGWWDADFFQQFSDMVRHDLA